MVYGLGRGLEWYSSWDNGKQRTFYDTIDPYDKWFDTDHGDGKYVIDGKGKLTASGDLQYSAVGLESTLAYMVRSPDDC